MATPHDISTANDRLASGRAIVRKRSPFFRGAVLALVPRESDEVPTCAVSNKGILIYNPRFFASLTAEQVAGALVHEVIHLVQRVHERGEKIVGVDGALFNIAADLADNPLVLAMGYQLIDGALFPKAFGFPENLSTEEYYARLLQEQQSGGGKGPPKPGKDKGGKGDGDEPGPERGHCGSCAGNPSPGEPPPGQDDAEARTDSELRRLARNTAEAIAEHASRSRGTVPDGLLRWAEGALQPPKVRWQDKLARACRHATAWAAGAVDHRYDGTSRLQSALGHGPGMPRLPRLRRPLPLVAFLGDTSGSMGREELLRTVSEMDGVLRTLNAPITFIANDAQVHACARVSNVRDAMRHLKGGGGTDLRPGIEAATRLRPRPNVLVIATDGYIGNPGPEPPRTRVIWLLIGKNAPTPATWGTTIYVDTI